MISPRVAVAVGGLLPLAASATSLPSPPPLRVHAQGQHLVLRPTTFCWSDATSTLCGDGVAVTCPDRRVGHVVLSRGRRVAMRLGLGFVPREAVADITHGRAGTKTRQRLPLAASPRLVLEADVTAVSVFARPRGRSGDVFYQLCVRRA